MITTLDTQSWSKELVTGNAQFIEISGILYVVSNVRADNTFAILQSTPAPPAPGPGAQFTPVAPVAQYTFPVPNTSFDPVVAYDSVTAGGPYLHIIGTQNNPDNPQLNDLVKFTFNINTPNTLTPVILTSASSIRNGYDIITLANGHRVVAVTTVDATMQGAEVPPLFQATITATSLAGAPTQPVLTVTANNTFSQGQLVKLNGLTTSTFLNGQIVQVLAATSTQFTAIFNGSNYGTTGDTGTATPVYSGENLLVFELDTSDNYIANTLQILASSPARSGNTFSSVSLVTPIDTVNNFGNGLNVEVYWEAHPKVFNFTDQLFTINVANRQLVAEITQVAITTNVLTVTANNNFQPTQQVLLNGLTTATFLNGQTVTITSNISGTAFTANFTHADYTQALDTGTATLTSGIPDWDVNPTPLFTFTGRYTDDRLTVTPDSFGNRYLSQTYWTQTNHPEGITGNVVLGTLQAGGSWFFHPILGSPTGGSIIQASLSVAQNGDVNMAYLLQPFDQILPLPPQGTLPSYPLHVATINPTTLQNTDVPGFYNQQLFTWLRSAKGAIDNTSLWAIVGERSQITTVPSEIYTIPASGIVQVVNHSQYWENVSVTYTANNVVLTEVESDPAQTQYQVEPSEGNYVFSLSDAGNQIEISYSYVSSILPVYESLFNVPPIAQMNPPPPSPAIVYRGQPLTISAAQTSDADSDPIKFVWTENFPIPSPLEWSSVTIYGIGDIVDYFGVNYISQIADNQNNNPANLGTSLWLPLNTASLVSVIPSQTGVTASLFIEPGIGGKATTFAVGLAAIDLFPDNVTPRHPALNVTSIQITGSTVTFTVNNTPAGLPVLPLIASEQLMSYSIVLSPPATPTLGTYSSIGASAATYFFIVTYLNSVGETIGSGEATITTLVDQLPQVTSPVANGDAVAYNVYASGVSGFEVLQTPTPIPLGTPWQFPASGYLSGAVLPTASTAAETFLNEQVLLVLASPPPTPTTFSANVTTVPAGYTSSPVAVTGYAIPQFQYALLPIQVPFNNPPTTTFPTPVWLGSFALTDVAAASGGTTVYTGTITGGGANAYAGYIFTVEDFTNSLNNGIFTCVASTTTTLTLNNVFGQAQTLQTATATSNTLVTPAPRNSEITITPGTITQPTVQYPVQYSGITDQDDVVSYTWAQLSGTPVTIPHNIVDQPSLTFFTNGANILGETLVFQIIVNDGVNPPEVTLCYIPVAAYVPSNPDTLQISRSIYSGNISQRNQTGTWGTLDISGLYNNLRTVKRNSVNDGTDRYIAISSASVLVYGGINPTLVLLRKLFTPNNSPIMDAVHTEDDYTLVIDNQGNLFRYSTAPIINTDNPDTTIVLSRYTTFAFNKIFSTFSYANQRIILLGGPNGLMLMQVTSDTLQVVSTYLISVEDNLLYGADNVQFFRTAGVENLRTGQVLIGSVLNANARVTAVRILNNALFVNCQNNFRVGDEVTLTGLTGATFLNNRTFEVIASTSTSFEASIQHIDYGAGLALTQVASAVGPSAVYTGTITGGTGNAYAGYVATVAGFTNPQNNGTFPVTASSSTTLTLTNAAAVAETATATVALSIMDTGNAVASNDGSTYETLIDLAHGQIIGTWDASKLINQFVNTGEILFEPNSAYSGAPIAPVQNAPSSVVTPNGTIVTISWTQFRPDLATGYVVLYSIDGVTYQPLQTVGSGQIQSISVQLAGGQTYDFQIQATSLDGLSPLSNVRSISI